MSVTVVFNVTSMPSSFRSFWIIVQFLQSRSFDGTSMEPTFEFQNETVRFLISQPIPNLTTSITELPPGLYRTMDAKLT